MTTVYCLFHTLRIVGKKGEVTEVDELEAIYFNSKEAHEEKKKRGGLRHVTFWNAQ